MQLPRDREEELELALKKLWKYALDLETRLGMIQLTHAHLVAWKPSDYEMAPYIKKILHIEGD